MVKHITVHVQQVFGKGVGDNVGGKTAITNP